MRTTVTAEATRWWAGPLEFLHTGTAVVVILCIVPIVAAVAIVVGIRMVLVPVILIGVAAAKRLVLLGCSAGARTTAADTAATSAFASGRLIRSGHAIQVLRHNGWRFLCVRLLVNAFTTVLRSAACRLLNGCGRSVCWLLLLLLLLLSDWSSYWRRLLRLRVVTDVGGRVGVVFGRLNRHGVVVLINASCVGLLHRFQLSAELLLTPELFGLLWC